MKLVLVGMNHQSAPLEVRERMALACGDARTSLREIVLLPDVREVLYLCTCNRIEILAHVPASADAGFLRAFAAAQGGLSEKEAADFLYARENDEAVRHLFRVAAGIDSLVMGEPQILGQVKEAYRQAVRSRTNGILLNKTMHHTFRVAKRIRTETGIADNAVSVSFAAVELAKKIFGDLGGKTVLVVGAGEMAELAARHLIANGAARILVANRTPERAAALAKSFGGTAVPFAEIGRALQEADIVISSTGASGFVINVEMVAAALYRKKNRLLFLIDIAVPRDIEPNAGDIDNVYLYNIDHLQEVVDENRASRMREAVRAEAIIEEEVGRFRAWFDALDVVPTIVALREKLEGVAQGELKDATAWLAGLKEEDRRRVEYLATAMINKILHDPITALKDESADGGGLPYVAAVRRLFGLDRETQKPEGETPSTGH
ncbi:MAG TPA: glutamyl-tRNA reductase [Syntrophales bacterium]|nr:glutamyl-tRNA reductase [Syntrophales bacterium]